MDTIINMRIKQVKKGDQNAFGEIAEIFFNKVYHLCFRILGNRHEAEDLAQEALMKAFVNINTFNPDLKFSTWLYRIATNLCIDRIRKKKPHFSLDAELSGTEGLTMYSQIASEAKLPESEIESLELQETIKKEIVRLPEKYRSVIILKYIKEHSLNEISEMLDLPIGTVKTRIHRGIKILRQRIGH